jgi:hypothetical protein
MRSTARSKGYTNSVYGEIMVALSTVKETFHLDMVFRFET